jgi:hypothetical protein
VNELRAVFDGHGKIGHLLRPDTPADAITRFEEEHAAPRGGELGGGGEACGAGTDDQYVCNGVCHFKSRFTGRMIPCL